MMFRFTTSTTRPYYRVVRLSCEWKASGNQHPSKVFPKADKHVCGESVRGDRNIGYHTNQPPASCEHQ